MSFSGFERNYVGLNLAGAAAAEGSPSAGPSRSFLDISGITGADSLGDGRGAVFADFDNDGDADIFQVDLQGTAHHLFRNNIGQDARFLRVELRGRESGTDAFGAVVRVKTSAGVLTKVKSGGAGFLSQHDPRLLFGLGGDSRAEWVEIVWPGGATQRLLDVAADSSLLIVEGQEGSVTVDERRFALADPLTAEDTLFAKLTIDRGDSISGLLVADDRGEATTLGDLLTPGRRTLINIWATWCIPCRKEMPELQILAPRLAAAGIDLIGLSVDVDARDRVPAFLADLGISYPSYIGDADQVAGLFHGGVLFVPMSLLIDEDGRVTKAFSGWSPETAAALEGLIESR
jgi:thiol-disulfide isomerase/thioredoxin